MSKLHEAKHHVKVTVDMDGRRLVIDCDRAKAQVILNESEDVGILARLAREALFMLHLTDSILFWGYSKKS